MPLASSSGKTILSSFLQSIIDKKFKVSLIWTQPPCCRLKTIVNQTHVKERIKSQSDSRSDEIYGYTGKRCTQNTHFKLQRCSQQSPPLDPRLNLSKVHRAVSMNHERLIRHRAFVKIYAKWYKYSDVVVLCATVLEVTSPLRWIGFLSKSDGAYVVRRCVWSLSSSPGVEQAAQHLVCHAPHLPYKNQVLHDGPRRASDVLYFGGIPERITHF